MNFLFDKEVMLKAISIAQEVISTKNINSVLSGVLIITEEDKVSIKSTDTKINFEAQVVAQIFETGKLIIYCNKFIEILNSFFLDEEIILLQQQENVGEETKNNNLSNVVIKPVGGKINFQIKNILYKHFPDFSLKENVSYFKVTSRDFKEMVAQTVFAVSIEETRYFLNGVLFEKKENRLSLVATDGRRLSFVSKEILLGVKDFSPAIVHPKILNIILKYVSDKEDVLVAIIDKRIFFKFDNYKFDVILLDGQFPNYIRVIPKKQIFIFCVKKIDLDNALSKHISLMLDKKTGRIYFNVSRGILKITSLQPEIGSVEEEILCEYFGDPLTIAFNFNYIIEPLKIIKSEIVVFEFTEEMKAVTMRSEPLQSCFHVIMPMQKE